MWWRRVWRSAWGLVAVIVAVIAVIAVVAVVVVGAAGRGESGIRQSGPVEGGSVAGGPTPTTRIGLERGGGSAVGELAPAFTVTTTTGETLRLPAGKPTVLSFATAWCNPVVETAALASIAREFGPRVAVVGVGVDPSEPLADLDGFAARFGGGYGYVQDGDGALSTALGVRTLDSTVVLDPGGRIVWRDPGPTDVATLRGALAQAGLA